MKCGICNGNNWIENDFELVCGVCGFVSNDTPMMIGTGSSSQVLLHNQYALGSETIIAKELSLPSINKKRTAVILVKHDKTLAEFSKCCNSLSLPSSTARIAFSLFKKLRHKKLGIGKLAVFCIVYALSLIHI